MLYLISYDLRTPGQDYPDLTRTLTALGAQKVLLSQWLVSSALGPLALVQHLITNGRLDGNDRILVTEVTKNCAWRNLRILDATMHQWLQYARP